MLKELLEKICTFLRKTKREEGNPAATAQERGVQGIQDVQEIQDIQDIQGVQAGGFVHYICGSEALPLPFEPEEESRMLEMLDDKSECDRVKDSLIEHNLRLVVYIARKFDNTGVDTEDLISIGSIGLIKAINSYRVEKNIKLATYASRCIENEILMYLRRSVRQKAEVSFDEPLNTDFDGNELLLSDVLGTDQDSVYGNVEKGVEQEILKLAVGKLPARERQIVDLRFGLSGGEERTQKEVADMLGISQSYISRLEKKIIAKLKAEIDKME